MALIRWEPFREINSLQREMNRLFDDMALTTANSGNGGVAFIPPAEMQETPEAIHYPFLIPPKF